MYLHFTLGDVHGTVISDGATTFPAAAFFANAAPDERSAALAARGEAPEEISAGLNCLLLALDKRRILIDAGMGAGGPAGTGQLMANLLAAGIDPESISTVILTHSHRDHAGGVVTADGAPAFPRAEIVLAREAWESLPPDHALRSIEDRLSLVEGDPWITPSVRVAPAPGHAPGHQVVLISSGETRLLHAGDVIAHPLHVSHPTWNIRADAERETAVTVRQRLLAWAMREALPVFGVHFPFPGFGHILADEQGWQWVPLRL